MQLAGHKVLFKIDSLSEEPFEGYVYDKILILSSPDTHSTAVHAYVIECLEDEAKNEIFIVSPGDILKVIQ